MLVCSFDGCVVRVSFFVFVLGRFGVFLWVMIWFMLGLWGLG